VAHEGDVALDPKGAAGCAGTLASGRQTWPMDTDLSFFWRPYQRFTRPRENITAENIEVRMPRQCTTAKPRTGPEPKASSARPAISVVTLESRMVANARS
jgi:hypothetical protein